MESTGTNGEEPRIIREKCPLILLEHSKKLQIPRFTAWLLEMTRQVMTRHFERIYFDENFKQSSVAVKRYHSKTK